MHQHRSEVMLHHPSDSWVRKPTFHGPQEPHSTLQQEICNWRALPVRYNQPSDDLHYVPQKKTDLTAFTGLSECLQVRYRKIRVCQYKLLSDSGKFYWHSYKSQGIWLCLLPTSLKPVQSGWISNTLLSHLWFLLPLKCSSVLGWGIDGWLARQLHFPASQTSFLYFTIKSFYWAKFFPF